MSIRSVLSVNNLAEVSRKILPSGMIRVGKNGVYVTVSLREWNRLGLDCLVNG